MEEISELKVIINKLKIEVLELTNRVLDLEKNKTPIFGFPEPRHDTRRSVLCNKGHNFTYGYRNECKTLRCDTCKQIISVFTLVKSCRVCDYDICSGCYGDIYPNINGYSVPITFATPP